MATEIVIAAGGGAGLGLAAAIVTAAATAAVTVAASAVPPHTGKSILSIPLFLQFVNSELRRVKKFQ